MSPEIVDPFAPKTESEGPGNPYAAEFAKGLGNHGEFDLVAAQEAAAQGGIPNTSETDPTSGANKDGDNVERIATTGGSVMGDKFDTMVKDQAMGNIDINDVTSGMSTSEIKADAHNARFDTDAQVNPTNETRSEGPDDPAANDDTNNAQRIYETSKAAAIKTADINASAAEKIARVAAGDTTVDFSEESKKLEETKTLTDQMRGEVTLTSNSAAAAMGENVITQTTAETDKISRAISEAESLKSDMMSKDSSTEVVPDTPAPETPVAATTAEEAIAGAKASSEALTGPIDFSEAYKQATDSQAPVVNPGAKAANREKLASETSISSAISHGGTVEMQDNWGSPEKMPAAGPAKLTPEQQAALKKAAGEQKPAA